MIVCGNDQSASELARGGLQGQGNVGGVRVGGHIFDVGAVKQLIINTLQPEVLVVGMRDFHGEVLEVRKQGDAELEC